MRRLFINAKASPADGLLKIAFISRPFRNQAEYSKKHVKRGCRFTIYQSLAHQPLCLKSELAKTEVADSFIIFNCIDKITEITSKFRFLDYSDTFSKYYPLTNRPNIRLIIIFLYL